jgi:hypothetical protein
MQGLQGFKRHFTKTLFAYVCIWTLWKTAKQTLQTLQAMTDDGPRNGA